MQKVYRIIKLNRTAWLKSYIDMNTKLRPEVKNDLRKTSLSLWIIQSLERIMENFRKHRVVIPLTTDRSKCYLVLEPNYRTTKWFSWNLFSTETIKTIITNLKKKKPIFLILSILEISKTVIDAIWYNYIKPMY